MTSTPGTNKYAGSNRYAQSSVSPSYQDSNSSKTHSSNSDSAKSDSAKSDSAKSTSSKSTLKNHVTKIVIGGAHLHRTRIIAKDSMIVVSGEELSTPFTKITSSSGNVVRRVTYEKRIHLRHIVNPKEVKCRLNLYTNELSIEIPERTTEIIF